MSELPARIRSIVRGETTRAVAARRVTEAVHAEGFRWVGVYEVTPTQVVNLGVVWACCPGIPDVPDRKGLTAEAVSTGHIVVCNDVAADPRYLRALASTGSEVIVPVVDSGRVVGTLDVESDQIGAFDDAVTSSLERVATELPPLFDLPARRPDRSRGPGQRTAPVTSQAPDRSR